MATETNTDNAHGQARAQDERRAEYKSLSQVKEANKANGWHFFNPSTMRFWACRIHGGLTDGRFFITSETNFERSGRFYTVREARTEGRIITHPPFNEMLTVGEAKAHIRRLVKDGK